MTGESNAGSGRQTYYIAQAMRRMNKHAGMPSDTRVKGRCDGVGWRKKKGLLASS